MSNYLILITRIFVKRKNLNKEACKGIELLKKALRSN